MKFRNVKVYGLEESSVRSGYAVRLGEPEHIDQLAKSDIHGALERGNKLTKTGTNSGHQNFLKGVVVQFDMSYPQYFSRQIQRYKFFEIISSQSIMHSIHKVKNFKKHCNKYVLPDSISTVQKLIEIYNTASYPVLVWKGRENYINKEIIANNRRELFQILISNIPMGMELWMGVSTNYYELKNIYHDNTIYKTDAYTALLHFIESLPSSYLIK